MKELYFLTSSLSFFILSSCLGGGLSSGGLSSKVSVSVVRYSFLSDKDFLPSNKRIVLYSKSITGQEICRPFPFTIRQARESLKQSGLSEEALEVFFGKKGEGLEQIHEETAGEKNEPVKTDVSENWLKFGLHIYNRNGGELKEKEKNNVYLVIDTINYVATANYKGQQFDHRGTIGLGYCDNAPFLYFIAPSSKIIYNPLSRNPFNNLTIFISGFQIIDRSNQPSYSQQQRIQSFSQSAGVAGVNQQEGTGQGQNQLYGPNEDTVIVPDYTVELILRGYFIRKSGQIVSDFVKRLPAFYTQSSLDAY